MALTALILFMAAVAFVPAGPARATAARATAARVATVTAARDMSAARRIRLSAWHWALRQRYKPYIWGGTGPFGFDCSGLVYAAYRASGIQLPRTTYEMLDSWRLVQIPKSQARRGDLAFFGTGHVELYDAGPWTYGAQEPGTQIGFHRMNSFWHPTMYFKIRE